MKTLTNLQARQFILLKQGLLGEHQFAGKQGALEYIRRAGCIQFDPVDLCGKNAELTLQSRVKGFKKPMLHDLLYRDRLLFDYPDKQLSIIPIEYWAHFSHLRDIAKANLDKHPEIAAHIPPVRAHIEENGAVCSDDFALEGSTNWWSAINWSAGGKLSRSVLEQMYASGDLIVHHKKGTRRYYDIAQRHIPAHILHGDNPLVDEFSRLKWQVLRRIGAVGLLWNRASDAFIGIGGLSVEARNQAVAALLAEGEIIETAVKGMKDKFYFCAGDAPLFERVTAEDACRPRMEFIAPLDPFMWDRRLIKAIFGFEYTWEIYTTPHKRKYGVYVLPMLYGNGFVGRVEAVCDRKAGTLAVKNIWCEDGVRETKKLAAAVDRRLEKFAAFNDAVRV